MQDEGRPVDREAWRRLLARGAGEPPRPTDERIRAEARRALAPRAGRWWLPASLAASLLLSVMIVQWQYEEIRAPALMTESDVAATAGPAAGRGDAPQPIPLVLPDRAEDSVDEPAPEAFPQPKAHRETPAEELPAAAAELPPPPSVSFDLPAAPAAERAAQEQRAPAAAPAPAGKAPSIAVTGSRIGALQASGRERADARAPEDWYAEILKLREQGRDEEAQAELERLEQAHPGWLEKHLAEDR
jgi:hypothetical protein